MVLNLSELLLLSSKEAEACQRGTSHSPIPGMATIHFYSLHSSSSLPSISSSHIRQYSPNLSSYFRSKPSLSYPFISAKPSHTIRPRSLSIASALKNLADSELIPFPSTADEFSAKFPSTSGVYAIYDKNDELQFVGISRNVYASLFSHMKSVPELCGSFRVFFFPFCLLCCVNYFISLGIGQNEGSLQLIFGNEIRSMRKETWIYTY